MSRNVNCHEMWGSGKLVTIKISHCYNVLRRGCNSYKQYVVSILLQHVFIVTILLQHISLVTMQIGCNNVKIKYLLLQRLQLLRNVVTQILVAAIKTSFEKMSWFEYWKQAFLKVIRVGYKVLYQHCMLLRCVGIVFWMQKIQRKVQTANFTVFTMCGRELPAEKTYFWWKLEKRKRIFLNDFHPPSIPTPCDTWDTDYIADNWEQHY